MMIRIPIWTDDYAAADRIARRMFPGFPNAVDADDVIAQAVSMGMASLRTIWNDTDDQASVKDGVKMEPRT